MKAYRKWYAFFVVLLNICYNRIKKCVGLQYIPHAGLVVFWVKLMQRGYSRSITGLYRFLKKQGMAAVKPPNPKYVPKPYEQMYYPGQRIQVDVKFVPASCLVGDAKGKSFFQYTAIDEYSRWHYVEAFDEHSTYSSSIFIRHLIQRFPMPIECVQTDNGLSSQSVLHSILT